MASKIEGIAALNALKDDWAIVARVLRLWSDYAGEKSKITTSIEMILVDVQITTAKIPDNDSCIDKNKATPLKRVSVDAGECDKGSRSPKLWRTIKIEKLE